MLGKYWVHMVVLMAAACYRQCVASDPGGLMLKEHNYGHSLYFQSIYARQVNRLKAMEQDASKGLLIVPIWVKVMLATSNYLKRFGSSSPALCFPKVKDLGK